MQECLSFIILQFLFNMRYPENELYTLHARNNYMVKNTALAFVTVDN